MIIENEQQFQISKDRVDELAAGLAQVSQRSVDNSDPDAAVWRKVEEDTLRSLLVEAQNQIADYEARQSCKYVPLTLWSFEEIPQLLMSVRIGHEMSHAEFAGRLGIDEEQLRCYEATEYASATMAEMTRMLRALDIRVRSDVLAPPSERVFGTAMTR